MLLQPAIAAAEVCRTPYAVLAQLLRRTWCSRPARALQRAATGRPRLDFLVRNFSAGDRPARTLPGFAPFTARFVVWTAAPDFGAFTCSDGRVRTIPRCALEGDLSRLPKQPTA